MTEELVGIIGGTGLGDALHSQIANVEFHDVDTPFGKPSDKIMVGQFADRPIAFLNRHGQGHRLMPSQVPYAANIFAMKTLGVRAVIASGAVGSLREQIAPCNLVIVDQLIDKTFRREGTFFSKYGAVHCEMAQPTCSRLGKALLIAAANLDVTTHAAGTYVCMEGPQFSTRAESLMHRAWGGELIGMTAMPEAKLAREAQICYALIALVSDFDCWRADEHKADGKDKKTLLEEIIGNLKTATDNCLQLIRAVLNSDDELIDQNCPCRHSLDLAVWTDQSHIDPYYKEKLRVLFE